MVISMWKEVLGGPEGKSQHTVKQLFYVVQDEIHELIIPLQRADDCSSRYPHQSHLFKSYWQHLERGREKTYLPSRH